ncbi:MAG: translation initiation factor IF-2 [Candidatus Eremiobacteraeota bacterium]|nr:translation initiation factor IF-2 [Candidatus Eremiobacteraeota bacterium]MBC5824235.1 translation initiation factor IF-2 [Candidatus Eremiobacteraeota bacterium]
MPTGKVRIFELAKELGLSSKDLIGLFDRLGLEAKNQLSVVEPPIADLVRGVLGGAAKGAPKAAATATATPPARSSGNGNGARATPESSALPVAPPPTAPAAGAKAAASEPIPSLKPVTAPRRPKALPKDDASEGVDGPAAASPMAPEGSAAGAAPGSDAGTPPESAPPSPPAPRIVGGPAPRIVGSPAPRIAPGGAIRPRRGPADGSTDTAPVPQLQPVPTGRSSIAPPSRPPVPDSGAAASAAPGPQTGMPGRPGVAPRPGQTGMPYRAPQPGQTPARPGAPGTPGAAGAPMRRPAGNGPFRPLTPPPGAGGPRPFTPHAPGAPMAPGGPTPSSGGPRGPQPRGRGGADRSGAKKDRETEMLLDKERRRKKSGGDERRQPASSNLETIEIPDVLTVQELATSMIVPAKDIIKELIKIGTMATINQNIPAQTAQNVARKFGFNAVIKEAGEEVVVEQEEDRPELLTPRPPVVTVLGHVDHGKTSLLDKIRSANVASGEAGGITQRIGAYTVEKNDQKVTFIDTPGHEAFTAMRARGAKVTDVAILVVAADDGVMPQTVEAISHIKAANVPIVVAMNKMDKEDAQPDRVKAQLAEQGLQPVDWGGKTEVVPVSARTGDGIDQLLETVLLEAELRDLKANKTRRAAGVVIESALDRGRGAVATVLVQNGTLRVGDVVVVGSAFGRIRALVDDKGKQVKKAGPSIPVEIMGLSDVPSAGDTLMVVSDERVAREAAAKRSTRRKDVAIAASNGPRISLESFMSTPADGGRKSLNLILKADGQGAVEALRGRVEGLSNAEVDIRVIYAGVGAITPNDVNLASASNAVLIGFNIRTDETVKRLSENEQVDLRFYQVIYEVENDLKKAMLGMLAPKFREIILGRAEVREVFKVSKVGTIAGCYVQSGKLTRNAKVRILRDSGVIFQSELESLRRFKDDVREVAENFECGVQIARFSDLKNGDVIEAFTSELVAPEPVPA